MSAAALILRIIVAGIAVITIGTIGVFGFTVIEPFHAAFGEPPSSLDWGSPASTTLTFTAAGIFGLFLALVIWFVYAPIKQDQRQQYR